MAASKRRTCDITIEATIEMPLDGVKEWEWERRIKFGLYEALAAFAIEDGPGANMTVRCDVSGVEFAAWDRVD